MATKDVESKDDGNQGIFENVEFVEEGAKAMEQPQHPFASSNNANTRKRKTHPTESTNDDDHQSTKPPPSKRAKTALLNHNAHKRPIKPPNYYQNQLKQTQKQNDKKWNKWNNQQPTLQEMESHTLFKIAKQNWLKPDHNDDDDTKFESSLVDSLYFDHISSENEEANHNIMILEFTHYLERYLWRFFDFEVSSNQHLLSMLYFINKKFEQQSSVWNVLMNTKYYNAQSINNDNDKDNDKQNKNNNLHKLSLFFKRIFSMKLEEMDNNNNNTWNTNEKTNFLIFLINCFYKMENESVRSQVLKLCGLPLFEYLDHKQRQKIFVIVPSLGILYKKFNKNKSKVARHQKELFYLLFKEFFIILRETESLYKLLQDTNNKTQWSLNHEYECNLNYIYNFCQLIIDNLCILMTRRYLRPLLKSSTILFLIQCKYLISPLLYKHNDLFQSLINKIKFYLNFEIDDFDGNSLNDNDMTLEANHKLVVLQKCVFKYFYDKLQPMALCTISSLDNYQKLHTYLDVLNTADLYNLSEKLHILPTSNKNNLISLLKANDINTNWTEKDLLIEIIINHHLSRKSKREQIAKLPLYPTERILFDDKQLHLNEVHQNNQSLPTTNVLALDKLNLQFLTIYDYLLRNYNLYKLESAHSIRDDIAKSIWKIRPKLKRNPNTNIKQTVFTGYSRMAIPIDSFSILSVGKPYLGETKPSKVIAEIAMDLKPFYDEVLAEWQDLRENDVLFLVRLKGTTDIDIASDQYFAPNPSKRMKVNDFGVGNKKWDEMSMAELGIEYVRGCHIVGIRDGDNPDQTIGEMNLETQEVYQASGSKRIFDVMLDSAQYQCDITAMVEDEGNDIYSYFNLLIRRRGKENNFKSILHTVTSLMQYSNNINVYIDRGAIDNDANVEGALLPQWFHRLFLGYDDPSCAAYYNLHKKTMYRAPDIASRIVLDYDEYMEADDERQSARVVNGDVVKGYKEIVNDYYCLDFTDCFIDFQHLKEAFVGKTVKLLDIGDNMKYKNSGYFRLWFHKKKIKTPNYEMILEAALSNKEMDIDEDDVVIVEPYYDTKHDGFGGGDSRKNTVRYTPIQVEAIKSGMHYGLTMVVGPPGSGKTDVAVQIINNLYFNFGENERILLVTHSNMALNDLFEKLITKTDIDHRHMLRLGYGYKKLQENKNQDAKFNFSTKGRIDYMLNERKNKLQIAQFLESTLNISSNTTGYCHTAETCAHFKNMKLMSLWEDFQDELDEIEGKYADKLNKNDFVITEFISVNNSKNVYQNISINKIVDTLFPFKMFISKIQSLYDNDNIISPFMQNESYSYNKALAFKYWAYILNIFDDIKQCHVFELLRTTKDRSQYLLTRKAKIVAMTTTHAAIKRDQFLKYKFEFDTLIMEESGQILDIETFIPMGGLQKNNQRLKRIILIGDHYQLPPIIKNRTFARYSKLDQSLFHRLIRLGIPYHLLNMQGRCRPNIRALWSWRYPYKMGDLRCVKQNEYLAANTGFYYDYQLINVDNVLSKGEFQPNPYFYQNLDEAEYVVNCYMYMRLLGYPSAKITILTTYNGQKQLLKEIINKKCVNDPLFGAPHKISTVDKYQGSQNEYILLSLVRTRSVGYLRDVRRLIVSLSRSKLGLYIFASSRLFQQCYELKESFNLLLQRDTSLRLVTNESYPTKRILGTELKKADYDNPGADVGGPKSEYFEVEGISHLMHIVNRMANSVREHFENEYNAKLSQYTQRARIALEKKRKLDVEREKEIEKEKAKEAEEEKGNVDVIDIDVEMKENANADKEEIDNDGNVNGTKEHGLDSKEQFDLAAQMALVRSNQTIDEEADEDPMDDEQEDESSDNEQDKNIEYESSSESSSED